MTNQYTPAQWEDFMPSIQAKPRKTGSTNSQMPPTYPPKHKPKRGDTGGPERIHHAWWDYMLQFIGGTCVILVCFFLTFIGWQSVGSGLDTDTVSQELVSHSKKTWKTSSSNKAELRTDDPPITESKHYKYGELIGYIYLPVLGKDWKRTIQQGVGLDVLNNMGAGHYENTAMPGESGNFSLAGHATATDFGYIDKLTPNQQIIIETHDAWYVYKAISHQIVDMHQTAVIDPYAAGVEKGITLTTCYPLVFWAGRGPQTQRFIVHGEFEGWIPKASGVPEALATTTDTMQSKFVRNITQVSRKVNLPVTGVLSVSLLGIWLILNGIAWMISHERMRLLWKYEPSANPVVLLYRLSAGVAPVRLVLTGILVAAMVFACWRWACPWMAENIPFLESPHPSIV